MPDNQKVVVLRWAADLDGEQRFRIGTSTKKHVAAT
jgi:hypothetical protein